MRRVTAFTFLAAALALPAEAQTVWLEGSVTRTGGFLEAGVPLAVSIEQGDRGAPLTLRERFVLQGTEYECRFTLEPAAVTPIAQGGDRSRDYRLVPQYQPMVNACGNLGHVAQALGGLAFGTLTLGPCTTVVCDRRTVTIKSAPRTDPLAEIMASTAQGELAVSVAANSQAVQAAAALEAVRAVAAAPTVAPAPISNERYLQDFTLLFTGSVRDQRGNTVPVRLYRGRTPTISDAFLLYEPDSLCGQIYFSPQRNSADGNTWVAGHSREPTGLVEQCFLRAGLTSWPNDAQAQDDMLSFSQARIGPLRFTNLGGGRYELLVLEWYGFAPLSAVNDLRRVVARGEVAAARADAGTLAFADEKPQSGIESPEGYYWVSNEGIARIAVQEVLLGRYRFIAYLEQGASIVTGLGSGDEYIRGEFRPRDQTFSVQGRIVSTGLSWCDGWDNGWSSEPLDTVGATDGVWAVYGRETGERQCVIQTINSFTCDVKACLRWSDDALYAGGSTLLVRNRALAYHLFERLEKWTYYTHGLGSVQRPSSGGGSTSGGPCGNRTCYEELVDSWALEDIWKN